MNLGSPVHSPAMMGPSTPSSQQGFLPGYLMGDYSHQQGSGRIISPTKLNRSLSQNVPSSAPQTPLPATTGSNVARNGGFLTPTTPVTSNLNRNNVRTPSEKQPGGPPITGLYSSAALASTPNNRSIIANSGTPYGTPSRGGIGTPGGPGIYSTPIPTTPQLSFGATPSTSMHHHSQMKEEIPYQPGMETTTWITVFGFPPSASAYIVSQFSQYGTVLQHHSPPNGNWMHIRYQTKIQAQKALSKSGKILGGSIMIGVSPCTDTAFMEEMSSVQQEHLNGSQLNASTLDASVNNVTNSSINVANKSSIRPLTQAYKNAQSDYDVLANPNTPDKANGFVTKAMEYVFGW